MRLLIAIKSCKQDMDRGFHDVIRKTWGLDAFVYGANLFFFIGDNYIINHDEIILKCLDDYASLPFKTRAILRWSLDHDYDFTFLADTDTYLKVDALMRSNFQQYDYMGVNSRPWGVPFEYTSRDRAGVEHYHPQCWPWCSGGFGVTLSRKAAEYIVAVEPSGWAEDMHVGAVLNPLYNEGKIKINSVQQGDIAWHFPQSHFSSGYDPKFGWMEEQYKRYHQ